MQKITQHSPIASGIGIAQAATQAANIEEVKLSPAVEMFDRYPDAGCISINDSATIAGRSRASLYRDHDAGLLPFVKFGRSTRIRVGDLRKYLAGEVA